MPDFKTFVLLGLATSVLAGCNQTTTTSTSLTFAEAIEANKTNINNGTSYLAYNSDTGAGIGTDKGTVVNAGGTTGISTFDVDGKSFVIPVGITVNGDTVNETGVSIDKTKGISKATLTASGQKLVAGVVVEGTNLNLTSGLTNQNVTKMTAFFGGTFTPEMSLPKAQADYKGGYGIVGLPENNVAVAESGQFTARADFNDKNIVGIYTDDAGKQLGTFNASINGNTFTGMLTGKVNGTDGVLALGGGFIGPTAEGVGGVLGGKVGNVGYSGFFLGAKQ